MSENSTQQRLMRFVNDVFTTTRQFPVMRSSVSQVTDAPTS